VTPRAALLSNGRYRVILSGAGTGASLFDDLALTRWSRDRTRDAEGVLLYIQDLDRGLAWSAGTSPMRGAPDGGGGEAGRGRARVWRHDGDVSTRLDVCVDPGADRELRVLTLYNHAVTPRRVAVTSYVEVALNHPAADAGHPAFSKLFVQTEQVPGAEALLARRRPRSPSERPVYLGHGLQLAGATRPPRAEWETDRARFIGRGRGVQHPAALEPGARLSGTTGNVLDPVLALRRHVTIPAGGSVRLAALLAAGHDREAVLGGLVLGPEGVDLVFAAAAARAAEALHAAGLTEAWRQQLPHLTGELCYGGVVPEPGAALPAPSPLLVADLRALGLSGRHPLVLARVSTDADRLGAIGLARVVNYWRAIGVPVDYLVLLDEVRELNLPTARGQGSVTLLRHAVEVPADLHRLAARTACHTMGQARAATPAAPPAPAPRPHVAPTPREQSRPEPLQFFNGFGGFSADGREYVIRLPWAKGTHQRPPLSWTNVIANEELGFLVTEGGAGYTWSGNSRENRLTPWSNDPVGDPHGEALYLRDPASGRVWSPTPGPVPGPGDYEVRHGFGYTVHQHRSDGLEQTVTSFVPRHDGVKLVRVRVANLGRTARQLELTHYAEWVLGGLRQDTARYVVTERDPATGALFAMNPWNGEFSARIAFAAVLPLAGAALLDTTADRAEFLGQGGDPSRPAAVLAGVPLEGRAGAGLDPCAASRVALTIAPGASAECVFLLGQAPGRDAARALLRRYQGEAAVTGAFDGIVAFWRDLLGRVQVRTPSQPLDLMVNGWLAYQNLACRVWGRSAFYQSGGAFGFRDQLQDTAALVYLDPALTRRQIVLHASHQFVEGDVLHWWHPPLSKGIRTRFSDDLLWLPSITAGYVQQTGDTSVLDEDARFLTAPALHPGEDETFFLPTEAGESGTVYEHCCRALDRSLTRGVHGLPLMGTGDWNDGMNRVGREGKGESVWLGFFLYHILDAFLPLAAARDDATRVARYRDYQGRLRAALNADGWDGAWYRRAWYDNGAPLGSAKSDECQIDAIAQAWAVLSGAAPADRAAQALNSLEDHLVSERDGIIRLLTPAFDRTPHDPGYIKGYLPGVRENGGQYTHGALWAVRALAEAGRTDRAARLLEMLSPVTHARTPGDVRIYQVEPYVIAADVYGVAPHLGRGGWTWYTGSAGWMFRVALESVLGLTLVRGEEIALRPCIPAEWPGYSIHYRLPGGATSYEISVEQSPRRPERTVATVDDAAAEVRDGAVWLPLLKDGRSHTVRVVLGEDVGPAYRER